MENKKIKVFLGGYINSINAQNLNCRSLANHLDRDKFEICALTYPGGSLSIGTEFNHIKKISLLLPLYKPLQFLRNIAYLRGLLWCDVAYLPKGEIFDFVQRWAKRLGKKTFITVEGVLDKETYTGVLSLCGSEDGIRRLYNGYDRTYSITKYMSQENSRILNIKSDGILYLGVENKDFKVNRESKKHESIEIVFIGNDLKRKRVDEFLELARLFPNMSFNIVGGNNSFIAELGKEHLQNVTYHGRLSHMEMAKLLSKMDLHVFPSRSEGFPKVTLETAAAGVPSIVYGDYGASEWITSGKDGFVVNDFNEIIDIIKDIQIHPEKLNFLSVNAIAMAARFDWSSLVKEWENVIVDLNNQ
ncbi:MAG: glycosyltransferase family 4 protein [Muribaculum sp.]|nr:glycosyltransferase family 4 protein [Muribaculum sp.]